MAENNQELNDKKIDVSEIDWNKLSVEEFHSLSAMFAERDRVLKENKKRKQRDNGIEKPLRLDGEVYMVKSTVIAKLKNMKSAKSKEKLVEEIKKTSKIVESL